MMRSLLLGGLLGSFLVAGCHERPAPPAAELISRPQDRLFADIGREQLLRAVVASLQDGGLLIDQADPALGQVAASRPADPAFRLTVTVIKREDNRILVSADARYGAIAAPDAEPYQDFFALLERNLQRPPLTAP